MSSVLIHVQYLKGLGHLRRVSLIAAAAAARGLEVHVVSGGLPLAGFAPPGVHPHQLPALQAGPGGFRDLRDTDGNAVDDVWMARRRDKLLALFAQVKPDVLVIETFPFGRRQLAGELLALLEAARERTPRPRIACSIRDILQKETRPKRLKETVDRVVEHFDCVLVHGDPAFARLEESFAAVDAIAPLIRYTGLVAPPAPGASSESSSHEVIVSAGGGAVGPALFEAAIAARPLTALADAPWRLITGPHMAQKDFDRLAASASPGVTVERFRADFPALLGTARLSISYAGYNTSLDVLRAGLPSVLVSYSGDGGETEQAERAARFARLGLAATLADGALSPAALAEAVGSALALPPRAGPAIDLDGARNSAVILEELAQEGAN